MGKHNKVIQEALRKNREDILNGEITPQEVIGEIQWGIRETKGKKNYTAHKGYCDILARHLLSTKAEIKQETTIKDDNLLNRFNLTPDN